MRQAIGETARRREIQQAYNLEHGITPESIHKSVDMQLAAIANADYLTVPLEDSLLDALGNEEQLLQLIAKLDAEMRDAAKKFEFERAAALRDRVRALKRRELEQMFADPAIEISTEAAGDASAAAFVAAPAPMEARPEPVTPGAVVTSETKHTPEAASAESNVPRKKKTGAARPRK